MKSYYILLDAMGIQSYIFGTNKLKIILGSSLSLDAWQQFCRKKAVECHGEIITSAGGNVLAEFTPTENRSDPQSRAVDFKNKCLEVKVLPPGMEIAWALTEKKDDDSDNAVWIRLQIEIGRYKAGDRRLEDYPAKPWFGIPGCQYCGLRPDNAEIEARPACEKCKYLYDNSAPNNSHTGLGRLSDYAVKSLQNVEYTTDIEELVSCGSSAKDLLAAVVVDLNNMGNRIKTIVEDKGFSELKKFSEMLENDILGIIEDCIKTLSEKNNAVTGKNSIRIRPLVAAGDDLIFILPAQLWVDFTSEILTKLAEKNYPACAGIAIAKHTFPIKRLVVMAEDLCGNAKKHIRHLHKADVNSESSALSQCALDWHIHQETTMVDPLSCRKRKAVVTLTEGSKYAVSTEKPYTLTNFDSLVRKKEKWDKIPSNRKLYTLYTALCRGPEETRETLKYIFLRRENETCDLFQPLWETVCELEGEYPLWQEIDYEAEDLKIYHTGVTDQLELRWLTQGPLAEGENG